MNLTKRAFTAVTLGTALAAAVSPLAVSAAENWPPRQITFVVALGPGGSADRTARALAQRLQEELDTPITVVNQQGGGGHVGHTYFMNMPDDGSYFLATSIHPTSPTRSSTTTRITRWRTSPSSTGSGTTSTSSPPTPRRPMNRWPISWPRPRRTPAS